MLFYVYGDIHSPYFEQYIRIRKQEYEKAYQKNCYSSGVEVFDKTGHFIFVVYQGEVLGGIRIHFSNSTKEKALPIENFNCHNEITSETSLCSFSGLVVKSKISVNFIKKIEIFRKLAYLGIVYSRKNGANVLIFTAPKVQIRSYKWTLSRLQLSMSCLDTTFCESEKFPSINTVFCGKCNLKDSKFLMHNRKNKLAV